MQISLTEWDSFYVITGSSAAALTGLMFVVIALSAERVSHDHREGVGAFSTPTVGHFLIVLLLASIMTMPLRSVAALACCLGAAGVLGLVFIVRGGIRMRRIESYKPVASDWMFNVVFPTIAYVVLLLSALLLRSYGEPMMFAVAAVVLALLFLGIRNAWDVAIFLVTRPDLAPEDK